MQIKNNISSMNVWKNYTKNTENLRKSMSKLSSGSRINNAGDDPSGLAMSERMRAQARNARAAANNVENKLNYLQTSDSWLQKIHDMIGRMSELAVMAHDGAKSQTDRDVLQSEFAQMQAEIVRITDGASAAGKFNGISLFQGTTSVTQQVGTDGGQIFQSDILDLQSSSTENIGTSTDTVEWGSLMDPVTGLSISNQSAASTAVGRVQYGIDYISEKRAILGAEMKRMEHTLDGLHSYEENITATESRIRDVDVAKETAEMSKYQILQQVGTAMLAQANQLPANVMQLFG
jgi:flagellin